MRYGFNVCLIGISLQALRALRILRRAEVAVRPPDRSGGPPTLGANPTRPPRMTPLDFSASLGQPGSANPGRVSDDGERIAREIRRSCRVERRALLPRSALPLTNGASWNLRRRFSGPHRRRRLELGGHFPLDITSVPTPGQHPGDSDGKCATVPYPFAPMRRYAWTPSCRGYREPCRASASRRVCGGSDALGPFTSRGRSERVSRARTVGVRRPLYSDLANATDETGRMAGPLGASPCPPSRPAPTTRPCAPMHDPDFLECGDDRYYPPNLTTEKPHRYAH